MAYHNTDNNVPGNDRNHTTPLMQYPSVTNAPDGTTMT